MSNDSKSLAVIPRTIPEIQALAEIYSKSTLLPEALRGKVPDIVVSIMAGQELGLAPMASIRGVHVVQGKPILSADTMVALCLSSGLAEYFSCTEDTDTRVTYETKRRGSPTAQRASWGVEDTKRAGLQTKDNWRMYPRSMMKARAKAILARDVYPDVLAGCYDPDEIQVPAREQSRPAPAPVVEVEDADLVEDATPRALALIAAAGSVDALKSCAAEIKALGLTGEAQATASAAYRAKLDALKAAA
jgi:hypothetical protein